MERVFAGDTSALWTAVGSQPVDRAIQKMVDQGWCVTHYNNQSSHVTLKRDKRTATLFMKKNEVGMIQLHIEGGDGDADLE